MLVPYSWLKEFVNLKKSAEAIAADISLSTIGVDSVSKQGREKVLNLDITYNRGDLLSIVGVAREAAALYIAHLKMVQELLGSPLDCCFFGFSR